MPKKNKQEKEQKEKKKKPEKKAKKEKIPEEKTPKIIETGLEQDIKIADEEAEEQKQVRFVSQGKIVAPVLEQISEDIEAQKPPEINWELSPERAEDKKEKKPEEYSIERAVSADYELPKQPDVSFNVPILRPERINIMELGRQREQIGREFTMSKPFEENEDKSEYELNVGLGTDIDRLKVGREKEQIGREYKPKH